MTAGIYKITNKVNGMIYIGQSMDIERRWKYHLRSKKFPISKSINEAGKENFLFDILLVSNDVDYLNLMERRFIAALSCIHPFGYNLTEGGSSHGKMCEASREKMRNSSPRRKPHTKQIEAIIQSRKGKGTSDLQKERAKSLHAKNWKVTYPDGKEEMVWNLKGFCLEHKIRYQNLANRSRAQGFKVIRL